MTLMAANCPVLTCRPWGEKQKRDKGKVHFCSPCSMHRRHIHMHHSHSPIYVTTVKVQILFHRTIKSTIWQWYFLVLLKEANFQPKQLEQTSMVQYKTTMNRNPAVKAHFHSTMCPECFNYLCGFTTLAQMFSQMENWKPTDRERKCECESVQSFRSASCL